MAIYTNMKVAFMPMPERPDTLESLTWKMQDMYLRRVREYTQRAFTPDACIQVVNEITHLYQQGMKLIKEEAPLDTIREAYEKLTEYKIPRPLKKMFSHPIILPFPPPHQRKKK